MYLIDTNIWLERLLGQAKSDEVGQFFERTPPRVNSSLHACPILPSKTICLEEMVRYNSSLRPL